MGTRANAGFNGYFSSLVRIVAKLDMTFKLSHYQLYTVVQKKQTEYQSVVARCDALHTGRRTSYNGA
jgi:hypothetical protein